MVCQLYRITFSSFFFEYYPTKWKIICVPYCDSFFQTTVVIIIYSLMKKLKREVIIILLYLSRIFLWICSLLLWMYGIVQIL